MEGVEGRKTPDRNLRAITAGFPGFPSSTRRTCMFALCATTFAALHRMVPSCSALRNSRSEWQGTCLPRTDCSQDATFLLLASACSAWNWRVGEMALLHASLWVSEARTSCGDAVQARQVCSGGPTPSSFLSALTAKRACATDAH